MSEDRDRRRAGELLSAVIGNVVAVPVVLGFVALGAGVLAGRAVLDVVSHMLPGSPRRRTDGTTVRLAITSRTAGDSEATDY